MHPASPTTNPKHQRFADEYLIDFNATAAYIRSGFKASGNAAYVGASKLLARPDVQAYLAVRGQKAKEAATVDQAAVFDRLAKMALGDIRELFDSNGALKPIHEMTSDQAALIQGVEIFEEFEGRGDEREHIGQTKKIRFVSKLDGIKLLGQHFGMFQRKVEVSGPGGKPVQHEHSAFEQLLEMVAGSETGLEKSGGAKSDEVDR